MQTKIQHVKQRIIKKTPRKTRLYKSIKSLNAKNKRTQMRPVTLRKYFEMKRNRRNKAKTRTLKDARSANKNKVPRGYA